MTQIKGCFLFYSVVPEGGDNIEPAATPPQEHAHNGCILGIDNNSGQTHVEACAWHIAEAFYMP